MPHSYHLFPASASALQLKEQERLLLDRLEKRNIQMDIESKVKNDIPRSTNVMERSAYVL